MNLFKKILIVLIVCGAVSVIFLTWYSVQHSQEEVLPSPARNGKPLLRVLVAADHVDMRDSLIQAVIHGLEADHVTIQAYDLSDLSEILQGEWSAIIVVQKASSPPEERDRVTQIKTFDNGFLITLRGDHQYILEGGGVLAPSALSGLETASAQIVTRVQTVLDLSN